VRVRERETYVAAGRVEWLKTLLAAGTINVRALGYLDKFKHRCKLRCEHSPLAEGTEMAWTLIEQDLPNGQLSITGGRTMRRLGQATR
jgi:hypothetical protein